MKNIVNSRPFRIPLLRPPHGFDEIHVQPTVNGVALLATTYQFHQPYNVRLVVDLGDWIDRRQYFLDTFKHQCRKALEKAEKERTAHE